MAVAGTPDLPSRPAPLDPSRVAQAAVRIIATILAFLGARSTRDEEFLRAELARRDAAKPGDIEAVIVEERGRAVEFARNVEIRMREQLPLALAIPDTEQREAAVRGLMSREAVIQRQRSEAMAARAIAAVDRAVLREESPQGAFWQLDPTVQEHTAGCLIMGGRFWPWTVLDRVHPPRHAGCPCRLRSYGAAISEGLMRAGEVMDVADALRAAASVIMEAQELADFTADGELREALVRAGLTTPETFDRVLSEARSDHWRTQPRDPGGEDGGQWVMTGYPGAQLVPVSVLTDIAAGNELFSKTVLKYGERLRRREPIEPIIIEYDPDTGYARIGEGNHRLAAAALGGHPELPAQVMQTRIPATARNASRLTAAGEYLRGPRREFPSIAKPSEIGLVTPRKAKPKRADARSR